MSIVHSMTDLEMFYKNANIAINKDGKTYVYPSPRFDGEMWYTNGRLYCNFAMPDWWQKLNCEDSLMTVEKFLEYTWGVK